jgi:hypothetical protein
VAAELFFWLFPSKKRRLYVFSTTFSIGDTRIEGQWAVPDGTYRHLITMIGALPKTKGPENPVPVVVALNPLP